MRFIDMQERIVWTIGHSTRNLQDFMACLASFQVHCVADIRRFPGSRRYPHFNKEALEVTLPQSDFRYVHIPDLGGRRKANADSIHTGWRLEAFRGYADYMENDEFKEAITNLEQLALQERTAYMCAESVWWRCHRSLVSDYLKHLGWKVMHIMSVGRSTEHSYSKPARIVNDKIVYDNLSP